MKYFFELPAIPPGKDFARDSFWWRYRERFARRRAMGWQIKEAAYDWFDREEKAAQLNGQPFPPKPVFSASAPPVPSAWDGRNEKPGRVPRG